MSLNAKPANQLTPRQLQLLKAIRVFQTSRCYFPTIAELASELSISRSTAFEHIAELRKRGLLSASPGRARSLNPTSKAQKLLNLLASHGSDSYRQSPTGILLAGKVAAGSVCRSTL
jgi:DNA-binding MarR family transcriptional regulator